MKQEYGNDIFLSFCVQGCDKQSNKIKVNRVNLIHLNLVCPSVKHSIKFYVMTSSGVQNIPDFVAFANFKEATVVYYDSNIKTSEPRQDWARKLKEDDPQYWERNAQALTQYQQIFKAKTDNFKQRLHQTGGMLKCFSWFAGLLILPLDSLE